MNIFRKTIVCAALLMLAVAAMGPNALAAAEDPAELLKQTSGELLNELNANRERFRAHPEELHALVRQDLLQQFDLDYSARLILGPAARSATPEQIEAFNEAMSELLVRRYASGLLQFESSRQLEVLPVAGEPNERLTRVRTRIVLDNGSRVPIDYAFRMTEDGWRAFDVTVEGISYVATYRNQIAPQVRAKGLDQVISDLESGKIELENEPES